MILNIVKDKKPKNILFYLPMNIEVDIMPLITKLRKTNINIFVPFIVGNTFKAVKFRLPLKINKFKIKEPNNSSFRNFNIDMAIVPVIGIDKNNRRIGFGKGMYDRYYDTLKIKPITVFVQRVLCKSNINLCESYDIKADYIITSSGYKLIKEN